MSNSTTGTKINCSNCIPNNGGETISFYVYLMSCTNCNGCTKTNVIRQYKCKLRTVTSVREKKIAVIHVSSQSWKLLRGVGCRAGGQL